MQNSNRNIQTLINAIENLVYHFNSVENYKKQILEDALLEQGYEELRGVNISLRECHVIDCIERNKNFNTTAIAKKLNMTKGGISKIAAKLVKKNMIEVHRPANNHKEIYYRLKPLGRKVFELHEPSHEKAEEIFKEVFSAYSQEELEIVGRSLADITAVLRASINSNRNIGTVKQ